MSHANARLTFNGRMTLVQRVRSGRPRAHVAKEMGVSRKTVRYWLDHYDSDGPDGLHDRSSAPQHSPSRTDPDVEQAVLELRRTQRRGQDWIGLELGVPARTVSRILRVACPGQPHKG